MYSVFATCLTPLASFGLAAERGKVVHKRGKLYVACLYETSAKRFVPEIRTEEFSGQKRRAAEREFFGEYTRIHARQTRLGRSDSGSRLSARRGRTAAPRSASQGAGQAQTPRRGQGGGPGPRTQSERGYERSTRCIRSVFRKRRKGRPTMLGQECSQPYPGRFRTSGCASFPAWHAPRSAGTRLGRTLRHCRNAALYLRTGLGAVQKPVGNRSPGPFDRSVCRQGQSRSRGNGPRDRAGGLARSSSAAAIESDAGRR